MAGADLMRTLQFSLTPAPGLEGTVIVYESSGSADVSATEIRCDAPDGAWPR